MLFVDDAQRLDTNHYDWLMDIYNELESFGITLTTILVGQSELSHRRNIYLTTGKQIVGRFMIHERRFHGIQSPEQLAYLLSSYDDITEYPVGSNWSYTRFFFPLGFDKGYRLELETQSIWSVIIELRSENGINRKIEIPMHYLISIINYVLIKYGANDESIEWPTTNIWKEAVLISGYINSEVINLSEKE